MPHFAMSIKLMYYLFLLYMYEHKQAARRPHSNYNSCVIITAPNELLIRPKELDKDQQPFGPGLGVSSCCRCSPGFAAVFPFALLSVLGPTWQVLTGSNFSWAYGGQIPYLEGLKDVVDTSHHLCLVSQTYSILNVCTVAYNDSLLAIRNSTV